LDEKGRMGRHYSFAGPHVTGPNILVKGTARLHR